MRRLLAFLLICAFAFSAGCATYFRLFERKSVFYSKDEKRLLKKTMEPFDLDYGYDPEMDIDYFYPTSQGFVNFKLDDKALKAVLKDVDTKSLRRFCEKLYMLKKRSAFERDKYRKLGIWKYYTFIEKYLLPPLVFYSDNMEKQLLLRDPELNALISKRKKEIDRLMEKERDLKEFQEIWDAEHDS
jgi:hypothetical protein